MREKLIEKIVKISKTEPTKAKNIRLLIILAPLFLIIFPLLFYIFGRMLDKLVSFSGFGIFPGNLIVGILLLTFGVYFALWSIYAQLQIGLGTPIPLMPTRKLVIQPPFSYCRNPMTLGTIFMYSGFGLTIDSLFVCILSVAFLAFLIVYIKYFEEIELERRFGEEYLQYKVKTPFIFPRIQRKD